MTPDATPTTALNFVPAPTPAAVMVFPAPAEDRPAWILYLAGEPVAKMYRDGRYESIDPEAAGKAIGLISDQLNAPIPIPAE